MLRCHLGRSTRRQRGLDEERLIGRDKALGVVDKGLLIGVDGMVYDTVCECSASKANASWVQASVSGCNRDIIVHENQNHVP